jgi:triacylglycerol lipase
MVSNEDAVYIIFRGTNPSDIQTWVTARVIQDPATRYARSPGARIHRGFRASFEQDFENRILTRLDGARDRGKPIVVIGHSLGASMATVAAARLDMLGKPVRAVYAFASPNVGNAEFKADYNSRLGQRHYRMINQEDIVPRLLVPPLYWAVGRMWYIDHKAPHTIRAMEFDDLDPEMTAYCTLNCKPSTFLTRHRHLEYWAYLSQNMPASVDRSKLPASPPMPR